MSAAISAPARSVPRARLSQPAREALAVGAIVAIVACALAIAICAAGGTSYVVPASNVGMPAWLAGPFKGLAGVLTADQFTLLVWAMTLAWAVVLWLGGTLRLRWLFAVVVFLHVLFALAPPLQSKDIFSYISYARLSVLHGANPYTVAGADFPGDAAFPYLGWRHVGSAYGPLFTLGSYPLAAVSVGVAMWTIKLVTAAASIAMVRLVWLCAERLGRPPATAVIWVGLNPILLVYGVGGGHNDLIMMFLMVAAVALVVLGREGSAAISVVAAAAVKATAAAMVPFLILRSPQRRRSIVATVASSAAVLAVSAAAFEGHPLGVLSVLKQQQRLVAGDAIPNQIAKLFGFAGITSDVRLVARLLTLTAIAYLAWRVYTRAIDWLTATGWAMVALIVSSSWLLAWYVLWPLPFAALSRDRRLHFAALGLIGYFALMRWQVFVK